MFSWWYFRYLSPSVQLSQQSEVRNETAVYTHYNGWGQTQKLRIEGQLLGAGVASHCVACNAESPMGPSNMEPKKSTWDCFMLRKTNNFSSSTTENLQEVAVLPRGKAEWKCPGGEPLELCIWPCHLSKVVLRAQRYVCRQCPGSAWLFIHHVITISARSSYSVRMWGWCLVTELRLTALTVQERESQL